MQVNLIDLGIFKSKQRNTPDAIVNINPRIVKSKYMRKMALAKAPVNVPMILFLADLNVSICVDSSTIIAEITAQRAPTREVGA